VTGWVIYGPQVGALGCAGEIADPHIWNHPLAKGSHRNPPCGRELGAHREHPTEARYARHGGSRRDGAKSLDYR
jgi:hypothetical protein